MNILPKKRWHVRNKDNIARVRKDEAKAEEELREKQDRQKLAEREARTELLRDRARSRLGLKNSGEFIPLVVGKVDESGNHINFFQELEDGQEESKKTNKEHELEKKIDLEKYEKQIGYLTYLGQDTNEALGKKNWYDEAPTRGNKGEEVGLKSKVKEDPLEIMKKYMSPTNLAKTGSGSCEVVKNTVEISETKELPDVSATKNYKRVHSKKQKHNIKEKPSGSESEHSDGLNEKRIKSHKKKCKHRKRKRCEFNSDSCEETDLNKKKKLEIMRFERMQREREERQKSDSLLAELKKKTNQQSTTGKVFEKRYNSQYNPELARQNYSKNRKF